MPIASRALIEVAHTTSNLKPSPIEPSWIIEGNPVAQASLLSKSDDGQAWTVVWQCSKGTFDWYYDVRRDDSDSRRLSRTLKVMRCPRPATVLVTSSSSGKAHTPNGTSKVISENLRSVGRPSRFCSVSLCGFSPKSRERSCRLTNTKPTASRVLAERIFRAFGLGSRNRI